MKGIFRKIHKWLSIPLGIFITLICFSGASLIFEKEITEAINHDLYYVADASGKALPVEQLAEKLAEQLPDGTAISGITISSKPDRAYQVATDQGTLLVDQYTGEVKGTVERPAFFAKMFQLHRWLLTTPSNEGISWGKLIVGISTIALVFILITGILMWLTNRKKPLTQSLKIVVNKGWMRFWHDLHVGGGIYVTIFVLAMALTGLTWSFSWYRTGFYSLFGVEETAGGHGGHGNRGGKPEGKGGWNHDGKPEGRGDRSGKPEGKGNWNHEGKPEGKGSWNHDGKSEGRGDRSGKAEGNWNHEGKSEGRDDRSGKAEGNWNHEGRGGKQMAENQATESQNVENQAVENQTVEAQVADNQVVEEANEYACWQAMVDNVVKAVPDYKQLTVSEGQVAVVPAGRNSLRATDNYNFDESCKVTSVDLYADKDKAMKMRGIVYNIHTGGWGGMITRIIYFLAALIGGTLPLTGYYLWLRRRSRRTPKP
jgi:uncharacterized iron-regulated membrane protein